MNFFLTLFYGDDYRIVLSLKLTTCYHGAKTLVTRQNYKHVLMIFPMVP